MRAVVLLCAALGAIPGTATAGEPAVRDAWVALAPPGAPVTAGYFVLDNPTRRAIELVAIESTDFARVELHETVQREGRSVMQPRSRVTVAAGGTLAAGPGGLHLMLHSPRRPLTAGTPIGLRFRLADGRTLSTAAPVRDRRSADDHAHHH